MDKINFIQSHSIKKEYEVRQWFYTAVASITLLVVTISIVQIRQIIHWHTAKQTYENQKKITHIFDQLIQKQQTLLKEKQLLEQRIKRITQLQNKTTGHPFFTLAALQKKHPTLAIENCSVHHKTVKLVVKSAAHNALAKLIAELRDHTLFKDVSLDAMHIDKGEIHATIHALLKYDS